MAAMRSGARSPRDPIALVGKLSCLADFPASFFNGFFATFFVEPFIPAMNLSVDQCVIRS